MDDKEFVRPSIPPVPGVGQLTPLDQYMVRVVLPIMCIFEVDPSADKQTIISDLQTGLSHTIDDLNFLAANIITEPGERGSIQLEYGDDAGVWFYAKELPGLDYRELAERNFPFSKLAVSELAPEPRGHSDRVPALTVQATFISGGLVLAFNIHHSVVDGPSIGTFLQAWSRHAAAASEGYVLADGGGLADALQESSRLFSPGAGRPLSEFPLFQVAERRTYESEQAQIMKLAMAGDHEAVAKRNPLSHWLLSEESLQRLRAACAPTSPSLPAVTDNAAISALVWTYLSRARQLSERGADTSSLMSAVNVRQRISPPMADEYAGNAIVLGKATATAAELEGAPLIPEGLHAVAHKVASSIDWWTADHIWAFLGAIEGCSPIGNRMLPPLDYDVVVTSPSKMIEVLGRCEWGAELGTAKSLRWAFPAFTDGLAVVLPSITGGIEIQLWTAPETTERLRCDAAWKEWVVQIE